MTDENINHPSKQALLEASHVAAKPEDLLNWIRDDLCNAYADFDTHFLVDIIHRQEGDAEVGENVVEKIKVRLFTNNNEYIISACAPKDTANCGYLGCIATSRKPRAGETWTRGRDLPDGKLCYATWLKILLRIVSYELVNISSYVLDQRNNKDTHGVETGEYFITPDSCTAEAPRS